MAETEGEFKFPVVHDKCPVCGCETTLIDVAKKEMNEKGHPVPDTEMFILQIGVALTTPARLLAQVVVPVVGSFWDACAKCGVLYCRKATLGLGQPQIQGKPGEQKPFFGNPARPS